MYPTERILAKKISISQLVSLHVNDIGYNETCLKPINLTFIFSTWDSTCEVSYRSVVIKDL